MDNSLAELETIVRNRVCRVCGDHTGDWQCALEEPSDCALFRLFPQVARAVQSLTGADAPQYLEVIRLHVCSLCAGQDFDGSCQTREQLRCSLDSHLLLVVDAIREAARVTSDTSLDPLAGDPAKIRPNPQILLSNQILENNHE